MGDITLVAFDVVIVAGLTCIGFGAVRRVRTLVIIGAALLLAVAGGWVLGLPGAAAGLVALAFLRRRGGVSRV